MITVQVWGARQIRGVTAAADDERRGLIVIGPSNSVATVLCCRIAGQSGQQSGYYKRQNNRQLTIDCASEQALILRVNYSL